MANIIKNLRGFVCDEREKNWSKEYISLTLKKHKDSNVIDHPDLSVTTNKLADNSVTYEKLSEEVLDTIENLSSSVTENFETLSSNISALGISQSKDIQSIREDINSKADKSTTLSGYGIEDSYTKYEVYSKTEADEKIALATDSLFENLENKVSYIEGDEYNLDTYRGTLVNSKWKPQLYKITSKGGNSFGGTFNDYYVYALVENDESGVDLIGGSQKLIQYKLTQSGIYRRTGTYSYTPNMDTNFNWEDWAEYAVKSSTLSGYGIEDAYTKEETEELNGLVAYMDIDEDYNVVLKNTTGLEIIKALKNGKKVVAIANTPGGTYQTSEIATLEDGLAFNFSSGTTNLKLIYDSSEDVFVFLTNSFVEQSIFDTKTDEIETEFNSKIDQVETELDNIIPMQNHLISWYWDNIQNNGNRTDYTRAFQGSEWTDITFKPKYNIQPTTAAYMFNQSLIKNPDLLEKVDFSNCINVEGIFKYCKFSKLPELDFTNVTQSGAQAFAVMSNLQSIEKIIINTNGSFPFNSNTFQSCSKLKEIRFEGVIGRDFSIRNALSLSKDSIINIFDALSSTTEGRSATFATSAVNKAFATSSGANNGSSSTEWEELVATKPNWTISLN